MGASNYELLSARMFFRAVFPVMKVVLNDDPKMKKKFQKVTSKVQISAMNDDEKIGAYLVFDKGDFMVKQGIVEKPDITLHFKTVEKMNDMLRGGSSLPSIKGIFRIGLLTKVLSLLMSLKLLMPESKTETEEKRKLKVKMTLYMITTAVSQYNKAGIEKMANWTKKQPDRIYQFSVDGTDIAAYIRIQAGKTKAGRGLYKRRSPFVHFNFHSVTGALAVLGGKVAFVEGVEKNYVSVIGAPEYSAQLNDFMSTIQGMLV
jgi:hypothetical protein